MLQIVVSVGVGVQKGDTVLDFMTLFLRSFPWKSAIPLQLGVACIYRLTNTTKITCEYNDTISADVEKGNI